MGGPGAVGAADAEMARVDRNVRVVRCMLKRLQAKEPCLDWLL